VTEVVTDIKRRSVLAQNVLNDPMFREVLTSLRQEQIEVFLRGDPPEDVKKAQAIVSALKLVEDRLQSAVTDEAIFDRQQAKVVAP
jgi:hydroxypyruvate isomerase